MTKGYHEYLELFAYFARSGERRLAKDEFEAADKEFKALAADLKGLDSAGRERLSELKALLFRDRP
jgi:hypothetical protein